MLIPSNRILEVIGREFQKLCDQLPSRHNEASSAQSIECVLRLLHERELRGNDAIFRQFKGLDAALVTIKKVCTKSQYSLAQLDMIVSQSEQLLQLDVLEKLWLQAMSEVEELVDKMSHDDSVSDEEKSLIRGALVSFESDDLLRQLGEESRNAKDSLSRFEVTVEKLTAYLQDRFNDSALQVTSLEPLSGGFGKETIVFSVSSESLNGEFVMRRDIGDNAGLDNDCHLIGKEYPVIRAVYARGFPAPDALWLDTEHALLPGSDFIVMRRSPGAIGGNFFGAQTKIPLSLAKTLANNMAQLHTLPPILELGDLNESICAEYWGLSKGECIERYIRGWYRFWRAEAHSPSPALVSLYGWLFDNVPDREGAPSMLHGDIGFHNFLVENGELSVVLDWEFAHIGDPAEELGYLKVTVGDALNWEEFMAAYITAGGSAVDEKTLHYFQVWGYVRNASGANIMSNRFVTGRADDLKLSILPYLHIPHFIRGAQKLIESATF